MESHFIEGGFAINAMRAAQGMPTAIEGSNDEPVKIAKFSKPKASRKPPIVLKCKIEHSIFRHPCQDAIDSLKIVTIPFHQISSLSSRQDQIL